MKKAISMRLVLIISFLVITCTLLAGVGYIVFSNWIASVDNLISEVQREANRDIYNKIDSFLNVPLYINDLNQHLLREKIVDLGNNKSREKYFAGVMQASTEEVYSFTYGTEKGEYYGARRNEHNQLEIVLNTAATQGNSRYYSINPDLTAKDFVFETQKFDPRTRDWYKAAKEKQKPTFSPLYKHFVMNDLAISAAYPIYDQQGILQGVLGTHLVLANINSYLKEVIHDRQAITYIVDKNTGELVANSLEQPNFQTLSNNSIRRIKLEETGQAALIEAYREYKNHGQSNTKKEVAKDRLSISLTEYQKEGLEWLFIIAVPERQFTLEISQSIRIAIILSVLALTAALSVFIKGTQVILRPIYDLIDTTKSFSQGNFRVRARISRNDEMGKLSVAFNKMAEDLNMLIATLESKVKERTLELEKANQALTTAKENAEKMATHDSLTGLPNRLLLMDRIETAISAAKRNKTALAVMSMDLDKFKVINDTYGHIVGDKLLIEVAQRFKSVLRESDTISRIGGDEFILLSPNIGTSAEAEIVARRLLAAASSPFACLDNEVTKPSISIGIAFYPLHGKTPLELIRLSDAALYKAKAAGRNRFEYAITADDTGSSS